MLAIFNVENQASELRKSRILFFGINKAIYEEVFVDKYECIPCGYIYDPEVGDPDSGIPKGTPFDKLPDDWVCPLCGASKDQFEKVA